MPLRPASRYLVSAIFAALIAFGGVARADDAADIRAVIESQTAALSAGDAKRAFGYATPNIQSRFGSSAVFMHMVEQGYSALIRPTVFEVEDVETRGDRAAARAFLVAGDGRVYRAVYPLARQPNGEWRIDGCFLTPAEDKAA